MSDPQEDDEWKPLVPKFKCPSCQIVVAVSYPQGVWCVDCEVKMEDLT